MESWQAALARGDPEVAWGLFIARYRRLILAAIRRTIRSDEDALEVFADVCLALSADGMSRLTRYTTRSDAQARFSTWLVVVVRNLAVDWLRRRTGRRRLTAPDGLSPLQREIFRHVFADRRSHAEAYELTRGDSADALSFGAFLREVAATYRLVQPAQLPAVSWLRAPPDIEPQAPPDPDAALLAADREGRLSAALEALPDDTRLALKLFVLDELPAPRVAEALGWRNAKEVYNRVYRALSRLRQELARQGLGPADL